MKKICLVLVIAVLAIGIVSAQSWGRGNQRGASQSVTVNGTLQLQNGLIAVAEGNNVYFVPMLIRYIGFIDGLKEGAGVSVEGYVSGKYLQPAKVTISGKSYDFPANGYGQGRGGGGFGPMGGGSGPRGGGYGPMGGFCGCGGRW
jgi:hypothetical protein